MPRRTAILGGDVVKRGFGNALLALSLVVALVVALVPARSEAARSPVADVADGVFVEGDVLIQSAAGRARVLALTGPGADTRTGGQKTLVALLAFPDRAARPLTIAEARAAVLTGPSSLDAFLRQSSAGAFWLEADTVADFVDWQTLPKTYAQYAPELAANAPALALDSIALLDPLVDFRGYRHLIFIYNGSIGEHGGGLGTRGSWSWPSADGYFEASLSWIATATPEVFAHEFGHNLGFRHASAVDCAAAAPGLPASLADPLFDCGSTAPDPDSYAYGDAGDVMGTGSEPFSTAWKQDTGWLGEDQVVEVTVSGEHILDQAVAASGGAKALRIPLGSDPEEGPPAYLVEYRAGTGAFDTLTGVQVRLRGVDFRAAADGTATSGGPWLIGNTLRWKSVGGYVDVADSTPFLDPFRGVQIELLERTGSGAAAQVRLRVSLADVRVSPGPMVSFGYVLAGGSDTKSFVVTNAGSAAHTLGALAIGGRHASLFTLVPGQDTCSGGTLPAGGSCAAVVRFAPVEGAAKLFEDRFAVLTVPSDDPVGPRAAVSLHGIESYSPAVVAEPSPVDCGEVLLGETGPAVPVTLTNSGNMPLRVSFVGTGFTPQFSIAADSCTGIPVPAGTTCGISVRFTPDAPGVLEGAVIVQYDGWPVWLLRLPVAGTGLATTYPLTVGNPQPSRGVVRSHVAGVVPGDPDGKIECGLGGTSCSAAYPFSNDWAVYLRATPAPGNRFVRWQGDCDNPAYVTPECYLKPNRPLDTTALFEPLPPPSYTVTVRKGGQDLGTISSADGLIQCGPDCAEASRVYPAGTPVSLTATAAPGWSLREWQGGPCSGAEATCSFTVGGEVDTAADFTPVGLTLLNPGAQVVIPSGAQRLLVDWYTPKTGVWERFLAQYSLNDGRTWRTIADFKGIGPSVYVFWNVPRVRANKAECRVRVTRFDERGVQVDQVMSERFTIEVVRLLSPAPGKELRAGEGVEISWRVNGTAKRVAKTSLYLSQNGAAGPWKRLATVKGSARSWSWLVRYPTPDPVTDARFKVVLRNAVGRVLGQDQSQGPLRLVGSSLRVLAPRGGEYWAAGTEQVVAWDHFGAPGEAVGVELLRAGTIAAEVASSVPIGEGSLTWTVPAGLPPGNDYRLRVKSTTSAHAAESPGDFTVASTPAAADLSLAIFGLGDTTLVTNQSRVTLRGHVASDVGLASFTWSNLATGASGDIAGPGEWSLTLDLAEGDNPLHFTAAAADGYSTVSNDTVLTFAPALEITTPLTLSHEVAYLGEETPFVAMIGLPAPDPAVTPPAVTLLRFDAAGAPLPGAVTMRDDGASPDAAAGDGIYSAEDALAPTAPGTLCYRAQVRTAASGSYLSESRCVLLTSHYTPEEIAAAVGLADEAKARFDAFTAAGKTLDEAAVLTAAALRESPALGASGSGPGGNVWWVSARGILGGYRPYVEGSRGGPLSSTREISPPAAIQVQPLLEQSPLNYLPDLSGDSAAVTALDVGAVSAIGSSEAYLISPYYYEFTPNDDYNGPWQIIKNNNYCQLYDKRIVGNWIAGTNSVTLSDFKNLGQYGLIDIASHGTYLYNGALSDWKPEWTPTGFKGYLAQSGICSNSYIAKKPDGSFDLTGKEADIALGRLAIFSDGELFLLPAFFRAHVGELPRSLVLLGTCFSLRNRSLANAFRAKGAAAVVGFTDSVNSGYAKSVLTTFVEQLFEVKTVKQAFDEAVKVHGKHDGGAPPAYFALVGDEALRLPHGGLENGGFEAGRDAWYPLGDARVASDFAGASPTEGSLLGFVGGNNCSQENYGVLRQVLCVPLKATNLTFDWNFHSAYYPALCQSPDSPWSGSYQEDFIVSANRVDNLTGQLLEGTTELYRRTAQELCPVFVPSDFRFACTPEYCTPVTIDGKVYCQVTPNEGVGATGWYRRSSDLTPLRGRKIRMSFSCLNGGTEPGDTFILLDDLRIAEEPPAP